MLTAEQFQRLEKFPSTTKVVAEDQGDPVVFDKGRFLRVLATGRVTVAKRSIREDVQERRSG